MADFITADLHPIVTGARDLSAAWKHGFINYDHFFAAMLGKPCLATPFLKDFDEQDWKTIIEQQYPATATETNAHRLPLTVYAEIVIDHARELARLEDEEKINSMHLLLSILSFRNIIKEAFNKKGIRFDDLAFYHYKKRIDFFPPDVTPVRVKKYSWLDKLMLPAASKKKELQRLYQNATDLYFFGHYTPCLKVCNAGLSLDPFFLKFKFLLVDSFMRLRHFSAAINILNELIKQFPEDRNLSKVMAYAQEENGNHTAASGILHKLLEKQPGDYSLLNNIGFHLVRAKDYKSAVPYLEKSIIANPLFAFSYHNLGFAMYRLGETEKGIALINQSLEIDKGNSYAYKTKGIIYMEQENPEEALRQFNLALQYGYTDTYDDEVNRLLKTIHPNL